MDPTSAHPPARSPDQVGAAFAGHFQLLEELGQGSSGTVYRARLERRFGDLPAGSEVAVKYLRRELLADPDAQSRLAAEGQRGRAIRSDQVVEIYAVESIPVLGVPITYLVMELVHGRSLREVLRASGSVVEDLARRIGLDAARGLAAVHDAGLVHRDIKPENLALTEEGHVKLMDLGLARRIAPARARARGGDVTQGGSDSGSGSGFFGSLAYAAPETLRGEPSTPLSDLYALGVVLFEVATGRHPFEAACRDADEIIHAHLTRSPPRPSHFKPRISAFLEQVVLDLLAKDPAARPQSAADLAETLAAGEASRYWVAHETRAPQLASRRRLRAMRRNTDHPFVNRRAELRRLDTLLREARAGHGSTALITGPSSMGRRRLLDHWLDGHLERRADVTFLGGEAKGGAGIQRAAPFTDMLLDWFLHGDRPGSPQALERLTVRIAAHGTLHDAEAQRLAAVVCGTDDGPSPEERAELLARQLLDLMRGDATLVLRVDLAEQLSTTAALVVRLLVDASANHRILLLLVGLDGMAVPPGVVHLPLHGLELDDFLQLARSTFAGHAAPRELVERAYATLAGSPGNLLDAFALLADEGKLAGRAGAYRMVSPIPDVRPAGALLQRLAQRLSQLTSPQRFVHLAAAVLGDTFPISDLAALTGQSELAVLEALSVFQNRIVVTQRGIGRFRHRDFRARTLELASPEALRRLHRTAAWVLEDRGAAPLEIGTHLSDAGEHAAAIEPLLDGLAHLTATGSRQSSVDATRRLRRHLQALPRDQQRLVQWLRFHMLTGRTEELLGREPRALVSFRKASCLAERLAATHELVEARTAMAKLELERGRFAEVERELEGAGQLLQDPDHLLRARILSIRARALGYMGQTERALTQVHTALQILPPGHEELRGHLFVDLARLEALGSRFTSALERLDGAEQMFAAAGSGIGQLRVLLHRGHVHAVLGNRPTARAMLEEALVRGRRLHNVRSQTKAHLFLGEQELLWGDPAAAIPHLELALELAAGPGDQLTRLVARLDLVRCRGLPTEDERSELGQEIEQLGVPALRIGWLIELGRLDEADQLAQDVTVPLHLYRRLLRTSGRAAAAEELEQRIYRGLPRGGVRRRFRALLRSTAS
ncbi:MAG: protein kinase [Planctomycetes bacterium]|nr:protein kinase [Planctomycetota bacterium]MCB9870497.1 protein kinase [Planctomycetota bacterium]